MSLSGKVAVVTGATSGIGMAAAYVLADKKVRLVLSGRNSEKLELMRDELGATVLAADVAEPETCSRLLETALKHYGRCDILINNAGTIEVGTIDEIDIDRMCAMVRINVESAFRAIYTFLKHFCSTGDGAIINISSVMGTKVRETNGAYAGTKYAIEALSESLRMELAGSNISISCIEPGLVMTNLHRRWNVHPSVSMSIDEPLEPEDVAAQILYILQQPARLRIPRLMILPKNHKI